MYFGQKNECTFADERFIEFGYCHHDSTKLYLNKIYPSNITILAKDWVGGLAGWGGGMDG